MSRARMTGLVLVAVGALLVGGGPAAADETDDFLALQSERAWTAFADARPVSPYFGTPGEHAPAVPFSRSYLDSTPGRAEAFAALYYPSEILEEGVLETTGSYENATMVRVNNPDRGRGSKGELAPMGPTGPRAVAETPSRTAAWSEARSGVGTDGVTVASGWGRTSTGFAKDVVADEATSTVTGLHAGDVRIGTLESFMRLEHPFGQEPKVSYRLHLAGVQAGEQSVVGAGAQGVTLSGSDVLASDFVDQFNTQADQLGATFGDVLTKASLRLVQPRSTQNDDGSWVVTGGAFELRSDNKPFEAGGGDNAGLRLGSVKVYSYLIGLGESAEAGSTDEPEEAETTPAPDGAADRSAASEPRPSSLPGGPGAGPPTVIEPTAWRGSRWLRHAL